MLFCANLSILWPDVPLPDRFERAARAGVRAVELWWPGAADAEALPALTARWNLRLALLNFDGGDLAAGERGLAADPGRREYLRGHVPEALRIARACGGERLNLLIGLRQERYALDQQLACARDNVAWAADLAARAGCEVMIEAVNPVDNGPYLLTTTAAAASFIGQVGRDNVRLQYDVYHMQRTEGDLVRDAGRLLAADRPHPDRGRAGPARAGHRRDQLPVRPRPHPPQGLPGRRGPGVPPVHRPGRGLLRLAGGVPRPAAGQLTGFSQTETCCPLALVNGCCVQPSQRSRSRSPAIRAIRSSSAGHTYRNGIVANSPRPPAIW